MCNCGVLEQFGKSLRSNSKSNDGRVENFSGSDMRRAAWVAVHGRKKACARILTDALRNVMRLLEVVVITPLGLPGLAKRHQTMLGMRHRGPPVPSTALEPSPLNVSRCMALPRNQLETYRTLVYPTFTLRSHVATIRTIAPGSENVPHLNRIASLKHYALLVKPP